MMMMPSLASKPSISTSSWFRVCSRSSLPPPRPAPRLRPTASISSIKMMHGADFLPCSNMSRTRLAPTPTNISTKSEPEIEKNGTLASPAMARASSVLPVPGGPTSNAPFGILPPSRLKRPGSFRKSTISCSSSRASSMPATSSKVTRPSFCTSSLARDLPKPMAPRPAPFCIWRMTKIQMPIIRMKGSMLKNSCAITERLSSGRASKRTPLVRRRSINWVSPGLKVRNSSSPLVRPMISSPRISTDFTAPSSTRARKSE